MVTHSAVIGEILEGKYELLSLLGRGGMGSVYLALHLETQRRVAVKIINKSILGAGGQAVSRFRREARAAGAIDSEHIIKVLDASMDDAAGPLYIVIEYLPGEDLGRAIERLGPLPPEVALRIGAQALQGLHTAHEAGIVHRDIKPANLFLTRRDKGRIVATLLDFGIAKIVIRVDEASHTTDLTDTDRLLGSPRFMSPEQARNSKNIDQRSDLWSLGASLYCALTGHAPHHQVESIGQLILTLCTLPPPRLEEVAPWVPEEMARVVHGALAIDPDDRYPSAKAMLDALQALLPDGDTLREEMLVALPSEVRALAVAPPPPISMRGRAIPVIGPNDATVPIRPRACGSVTTIPSAIATLSSSRSDVADTISTTRPDTAGTTRNDDTLVQRPAPAALPSKLRSSALLVAALTLGVLGVGALRGIPTSIRHARLVVLPVDAAVEVDGVAVDVRGGIVEITGAFGSGHRVRLFKGTNETRAEVFVTEEGAQPPKVELLGQQEQSPPMPADAGPTVPADAGPTMPVDAGRPLRMPMPLKPVSASSAPSNASPAAPCTHQPAATPPDNRASDSPG